MSKPLVSIIMGSQSDWETMREATSLLNTLNIPFETKVISAHRTPHRLFGFAQSAEAQGIQIIIAGAGGSAHLPGMVAALTTLPVVAVPVQSRVLKGIDSLLSIVQMPRGVCVATQAIGAAGAFNAGLMASQILALSDSQISENLKHWRNTQTSEIAEEVA